MIGKDIFNEVAMFDLIYYGVRIQMIIIFDLISHGMVLILVNGNHNLRQNEECAENYCLLIDLLQNMW